MSGSPTPTGSHWQTSDTRFVPGLVGTMLADISLVFYSDVEREEKQLRYYQVKLEAAETKLRDFDKYFSEQEDQSDLTKKLIDERESQTLKIFHLSEKLKVVLEREQTLKAEVQEAKDQSDLLEFRVLELEECQEKEKVIKLMGWENDPSCMFMLVLIR